MYPFHCRGIACAGINLWTLEDVCRMSLHKFRAKLHLHVVRYTTPVVLVISRAFSLAFRAPPFLSLATSGLL